ncbi:hypothetical protein BXY64_0323 [Marinifilum flexuosum]|uniref:Uncharacterized protein n=1 Tax=Marinifilum flexuosum TaxID=1117708 RepID=A0A419X6Z2_9BACT|nr:hypothetical protein BXY64_0323 [Marinifilum flexuosum]
MKKIQKNPAEAGSRMINHFAMVIVKIFYLIVIYRRNKEQ